jgi:hypothetical protein
VAGATTATQAISSLLGWGMMSSRMQDVGVGEGIFPDSKKGLDRLHRG